MPIVQDSVEMYVLIIYLWKTVTRRFWWFLGSQMQLHTDWLWMAWWCLHILELLHTFLHGFQLSFRDFLCFKCIPQVFAMSFEISQGFQVQRNLKSALLLAFVILGMALWLEQGVPSRKLKRQWTNGHSQATNPEITHVPWVFLCTIKCDIHALGGHWLWRIAMWCSCFAWLFQGGRGCLWWHDLPSDIWMCSAR